jgi:hypothetical protein
MDVGHAIYALEGSDGLILSGGEDVDPSHYGAERSPHLKEVDPRRDALELALFAAAKERHRASSTMTSGTDGTSEAIRLRSAPTRSFTTPSGAKRS